MLLLHNAETSAFPLKCYTVLKLEIAGTVSLDHQSLPPMSQCIKHALTFFKFVLHLKESLTPSSLWNFLVFSVKASTVLSNAYVGLQFTKQ